MRELNDALQKLIPSAPAQNPTETAAANPTPTPGSGNYDAALEAATQRQEEEAASQRTPMDRRANR
jgi:hypothetical protein